MTMFLLIDCSSSSLWVLTLTADYIYDHTITETVVVAKIIICKWWGCISTLETISFNRNWRNPIFGGMQFWGFWFLIVIPYMIYYIHITIDYIDSSIHLVTLPEYRNVILWYTKWYNPINKNRIMTVLFASR